jgi:hypothetical protein
MKTELRKSLDKYYEELDALARKYRADMHETKTDKSLSAFGKEKKAEVLKGELAERVRDLRLRFEEDVSVRLANIGDALRPPDAERARVRIIKQKLAEGERFMGQESLFYALLGSIDELREDLGKNTFVSSVARLSNEDMARVFNDAVERRDTKRLEWLKEAAMLTGRDSAAFVRSVDAQIEQIEDAKLTSEQRMLKATAGELAKQRELFGYSVERAVGSEGEFVDLRGEESGTGEV